MRCLVHGGAGTAPDKPTKRLRVVERAASAGHQAGTPESAVVAAVRALESDPRFNAGVGSAVQSDGRVRTDAGLMTSDRAVGAACAMSGVEHAVEAARVVKDETPHVLVAGEHAVDLAAAFGVETDVDLWTDRTRARWADLDAPADAEPREQLDWLREQFGGSDTVGAVATDGERLAAATSTGGRWCALAGRVGDVPQVGCGFYCTEEAAASATGAGEDIARMTLSRRVVDLVADGATPEDAAARAIEELEAQTGSGAGVIVADSSGRVGEAFNTEAMQTADSGG